MTFSPTWVRPLPVLAVAATAAVIGWTQRGSIASPDWLPLAVIATLVVAVVLASGAAVRLSRPAALGISALGLLAGWTACTIAWAPSGAGARDEALLVGLYAVTMAIPALTLRTAAERLVATTAVIAALAALAIVTALDLVTSTNATSFFFAGRLDLPITYVNACSALFALGVWPAIAIASRKDGGRAGRVAALATAALFLALVVAAQSKGTILGIAASAIVVFAVSPTRLRLLLPTVAAVLPALVLFDPLTAPYRSQTESAAHEVGWAALAALAAGCALGFGYLVAERRVRISATQLARISRGLKWSVVALPCLALILFFVTVGSPGSYLSDKWRAFKQPDAGLTGSSHLTSLGSNRYDFWRVALDEAASHPIAGIGGRGFYNAYLEHRRSSETPLRAHSLPLDVLAEEGIPGLLLLLVAFGAPIRRLVQMRQRPAAVATLGTTVYFLVHASVDWIWTVPVVGVFAFLLLGIGCSDTDAPVLPRRSVLQPLAAVAIAFLVFAPPWLAHLYVNASKQMQDPSTDLRLAHDLDPLSLDPYWARWERSTTPAARVEALDPARRQEPTSVAVLYQLGVAYLQAGDRTDARIVLARAHRLDPEDATVRAALNSA